MKKLALLFSLILLQNALLSQICGTPSPSSSLKQTYQEPLSMMSSVADSYCLNIYYHIVRNTNGTNAFTPPDLD